MIEKYKFEKFDTLWEALQALENRPPNSFMRGNEASETGDEEFTGTSSYDEAVDIMKNGYPRAVDEIKKHEKNLRKVQGVQLRNKNHNDMIGHTPIVPNLLIGIPTNMINTKRIVQKAKTVSIIWDMGENCNIRKEEIEKASIVVLEAITMMEQGGIRVKLDSVIYSGTNNNGTYLGASITVKGYREKLDITRVSGLMAHASTFRRIGFRWLETSPLLDVEGYAYGYGTSIHDDTHKFMKWIEDNFFKDGVYIALDTVRRAKFDSKTLVDMITQKLEEKAKNRK